MPYAAEATPPEILMANLNELSELVDVVVVVEATETFTGKRSVPIVKDMISGTQHAGRVMAMTIDFPSGMSAWGRDDWSRGAVGQAVGHVTGVNDETHVLFGDADEIPHPETLANALTEVGDAEAWMANVMQLPGRYHEWYLDLVAVGSPDHLWEFRQPVITTWGVLARRGGERLRGESGRCIKARGPLGWHFTLQGGAEACATKLASYAHTELGDLDAETLQAEFIDKERDILDRAGLVSIPISELPVSIKSAGAWWIDWVLPRTRESAGLWLP